MPISLIDSTPYVAYQTHELIQVDGQLSARAWQLAPKSPPFVDVISGEAAPFETHAAIL